MEISEITVRENYADCRSPRHSWGKGREALLVWRRERCSSQGGLSGAYVADKLDAISSPNFAKIRKSLASSFSTVSRLNVASKNLLKNEYVF